ncbi:TPA: hypothetical protein ACXNQ3_001397 [Serratia marcescens]|uniref:hypothetical protein n=1 Tax=Serratia marcescens TaxID=615 RepID=UPI003FA6A938
MKKATKRILSSMGSILDICPANDYKEFRNLPSDNELMKEDWVTVGEIIKDTMKDHGTKKAIQACQ